MLRRTQWMTALLLTVMLAISVARGQEQPTTAPTTTESPATQLAATEPATQPATTTELVTTPLVPTQIATTEPATTQVATTEPAATQMATTQPGATTQAASAPEAPAGPEVVNPALAERMTSMATGLLRTLPPTPATWRYAAVLLESATRLAPDEPRYWQFLIEAATRAGDADMAIKALSSYRKVEPDDEFAQVQLMELYLGRMERSEAKLEYLRSIVESVKVGPAVRSVAAVRCAQVMAERLDNTGAWKMIDTALETNPLNLEALRIHFERIRNGTADGRLTGLLRMVLANPAQPTVAADLARELARAGLIARSIEWFNLSVDLHRRMAMVPPSEIGVDYAAELFISGEKQGANTVVSSYPDDLNAWMLRLIIAKAGADKQALPTTIQQATGALSNRLAAIQKAAGDTSATTKPVDSPDAPTLPDPDQHLRKVIAAGKKELTQQFGQVAGMVAWMKIYFEEKPGQAVPWTKAAAAALGEDDPVVTRLQGWAFLVAGNKDGAKAKLAGVADKDPIAALGLIRASGNSPETTERAKKLLAENPSGLNGALLLSALSDRGLKVHSGSDAAKLEQFLAAFPKDWFKIIDQPSSFYSLRMDPVSGRVGVPVGEPVLVQISIYNLSNYPLTVGPEGVIHPDLWLDARIRGAEPGQFPAEAYARLSGPLVLLPKSQVSQVVRLDQGMLQRRLDGYPTKTFQITGAIITNPMTVQGQATLGPAGQRADLSKLIERMGTPISQDSIGNKLGQIVEGGTAAERVRATEILFKFAGVLNADQSSDVPRQMGARATELVRRETADPDPTVRAWASYLYCVLSNDRTIVGTMLQDQSWAPRALGIVVTDLLGLSREPFNEMARRDPDPLVRNLAKAAAEASRPPPTSQPTTEPSATQPAVAEATAADAEATTEPTAAAAATSQPSALEPVTQPAMPVLAAPSPSAMPPTTAPKLEPALPSTQPGR